MNLTTTPLSYVVFHNLAEMYLIKHIPIYLKVALAITHIKCKTRDENCFSRHLVIVRTFRPRNQNFYEIYFYLIL